MTPENRTLGSKQHNIQHDDFIPIKTSTMIFENTIESVKPVDHGNLSAWVSSDQTETGTVAGERPPRAREIEEFKNLQTERKDKQENQRKIALNNNSAFVRTTLR